MTTYWTIWMILNNLELPWWMVPSIINAEHSDFTVWEWRTYPTMRCIFIQFSGYVYLRLCTLPICRHQALVTQPQNLSSSRPKSVLRSRRIRRIAQDRTRKKSQMMMILLSLLSIKHTTRSKSILRVLMEATYTAQGLFDFSRHLFYTKLTSRKHKWQCVIILCTCLCYLSFDDTKVIFKAAIQTEQECLKENGFCIVHTRFD